MAQAVGAEPLGAVQAGGPGEAAHQAERCRFVVATAAAGDEQRASVPPGEVVVEGPGGDRGEHDCRSPAAFAGDVQHPVASLGAEGGGGGRQRRTDAQAVVGEQGEQGQVPAALAGAGQSSRDLALLTLLAHNGLRIGEALAADATDLGTERGHRVLHITRKGGRRATVVLAPVTARALDDYLTGRDTGPLFITGGGRRYDEPAETGSVPPGAPPRPGRRPGLRRAAQPPQPAPCVRHPGPRRRRVPARRTGRRRARRPPAPPGATTGPGTTST